MTEWKAQLESFDSLLKELKQNREQGGRLRFGRSAIVASDIAEQFYCEKKVEMEYLRGEVETEAKHIGTEAHEKLTEDSVKVKRAELWQKIMGTNLFLLWRCSSSPNTAMCYWLVSLIRFFLHVVFRL
jgi:hypothetical protein